MFRIRAPGALSIHVTHGTNPIYLARAKASREIFETLMTVPEGSFILFGDYDKTGNLIEPLVKFEGLKSTTPPRPRP